ncbi:MAG: molybdopterin-dependent oxidoreductase [Actinomycetes bacterium]
MTATQGPARPKVWPRFTSPLRSTAVTARLGSLLGICIVICFATGMLSHYQYSPWSWLPEPASPVWGYRLSQGLHVITGIAAIPLTLVKLWSVYPNLYRWPPLKSLKHAAERLSIAVLVSAVLVQLATGFMNVMGWYPWPWGFVSVHRFLAYVIIGSILLHIGIKLPDIKYGLQAKVADADVLTETPWSDNPDAHTNAGDVPPPATPALTRRGLLVGTGVGVGLVVATTVGQTLTPLEPIGLLAVREPEKGPQGVPVNKTAASAGITEADVGGGWTLTVDGPSPFTLTLDEVEAMSEHVEHWPINCVEGWSVGAQWQGLRLLDLVTRAGGTSDSRVRVLSVQQSGYNESDLVGPQVSVALLATHINTERLNLDHGYPLRLISPNRAGVLNTKWLNRVEVT